MTIAVVAEKPSVARDIARVLGASQRGEGRLSGGGYVVTWAIGHLVRLAEPPEIRPEWKRWAAGDLPMLPSEWPLLVADRTKDQFRAVQKVLREPDVTEVVCATDAGREGELIFRYIYEAAGCRKPVRRLWISSLTPDAIRRGFQSLRPRADFDPLADAAHGRTRADWLVGMNLSRAATLAHGELFSVGRVQTPTLALLVEREKAIRAFVPEDYLEVVATFAPGESAPGAGSYRGTWFRGERPTPEARRLPPDGVEARAIVERVRGGRAEVESVESETRRIPPPLLYDLTELQRHANRLYGLSAKETLAVAQALYEEQKLLTYPRTDSRHLSRDVAATLPAVVAAIAGPYSALLAPGTGERPLGRRFVDDAKVTDHHAIIPTAIPAEGLALSRDERRVYDLVCRRLLMAWHDEHVFAVTTVVTRVSSGPPAPSLDRFASSGTAVRAGGLEGPRAASLAPGPPLSRRREAGRRRRRGARPPAGPRPRTAEAGRRGRGAGEEDPAAPPLHRRDAPHRDGEGRSRPRRPRAVRGHEGERPRHPRDARRDHRDAPAARLRGAAGQGARRHRQGHPAHRPRPSAGEEPRADRRVGSPARAHAPEGGRPARVHGAHRGLRARPGRADARGPCHPEGPRPAGSRGIRQSPRRRRRVPRRPSGPTAPRE